MRIQTLCVRTVASIALLAGLSFNAHALTLGQIAQQAKQAERGPFGAIELVSTNAANRVNQWNQALTKTRAEAPLFASCLQNQDNCKGAAMTAWRDMVLTLINADKMTQLRLVNSFFNRWQYREDRDVYGVSDKWASPAQFMANSGDCEDYAIAKYFTLSVLGFHDRDLRIMAVIDNTRGIGHSVLAVKAEGAVHILDNLSNAVLKDAEYAQAYTPRFAVNASGVWTYNAAPTNGMMLASAQ